MMPATMRPLLCLLPCAVAAYQAARPKHRTRGQALTTIFQCACNAAAMFAITSDPPLSGWSGAAEVTTLAWCGMATFYLSLANAVPLHGPYSEPLLTGAGMVAALAVASWLGSLMHYVFIDRSPAVVFAVAQYNTTVTIHIVELCGMATRALAGLSMNPIREGRQPKNE